jgi:MFS family permease
MLIIWLQGIWLPLHGYSYEQTPLWAGIFLLPMTAGFMASGPTSGILSDKFGSRGIATSGMAVFASSFIALMLIPVDFPYWLFALLIALNGIGSGMFASPNTSSIMGSVPASDRGAASGMRSTFQNSGTAVSIGVVFTLMIAGLSSSLPSTLTSGLTKLGVPGGVAHQVASLPPVSSLFASVLGVNPIQHLLSPTGVLAKLPAANQAILTGREFFPSLLQGPFHNGLIIVFGTSAALSVLAGLASLLRGGRTVPDAPLPAAVQETAGKKSLSPSRRSYSPAARPRPPLTRTGGGFPGSFPPRRSLEPRTSPLNPSISGIHNGLEHPERPRQHDHGSKVSYIAHYDP